MREVFSSDHLKRKARKNLAICLGAVGFASALLVAGIVAGLMLLTVLGAVALVTCAFIVTKRGRMYVTYRCGMQGEHVLRNGLRSLGLSDEHTAYYNLPLKDQFQYRGQWAVSHGLAEHDVSETETSEESAERRWSVVRFVR